MTLHELIGKLTRMVWEEPDLGNKRVYLYVENTEGYAYNDMATDVWFNQVTDHVIIDNC